MCNNYEMFLMYSLCFFPTLHTVVFLVKEFLFHHLDLKGCIVHTTVIIMLYTNSCFQESGKRKCTEHKQKGKNPVYCGL